MEHIKDYVQEILPESSIELLASDKKDDALEEELLACIRRCNTTTNLVYLVHVKNFSQSMLALTGLRKDQYYMLFYRRIMYGFAPNAAKRDFQRALVDTISQKESVCDICTEKCFPVYVCNCKYRMCTTCKITLVYHALGLTHLDKIKCPNCRAERNMITKTPTSFVDLILRFIAEVECQEEREVVSKAFADDMRGKAAALLARA